jgi:K+-sensing histidine kinase KdpD
MLLDARSEKASGVDVVAGYVEPHGRPETRLSLRKKFCSARAACAGM